MSHVAEGVQLFVAAGVVFLALGSLVAAVMVRLTGARLMGWEPQARHRVILGLAVLPAAFALVLLFAVSLPSFAALFEPKLDHCYAHDDAHAHLCFVHLPSVGVHASFLLLFVFLATYIALRAAFAASNVLRALRVAAALARTGEQRQDLGITLVESSQPLCFTVGLFRPRVLLSRGLVDLLASDERAVVLAHEQAHVRRRDALWALLVRALGVVHLPSVRRWLTRELEVAAEQACDEAAGRLLADRVCVASAILTVERAVRNTTVSGLAPAAVAFGGRAVERRVEALLSDPTPPPSLRPVAVAITLSLIGVFGVAYELHHATESVLSLIAR